jgi:hypothetical protein
MGEQRSDLAVQAAAARDRRANWSYRAGEWQRRDGGIQSRSENERGKKERSDRFFITSGR